MVRATAHVQGMPQRPGCICCTELIVIECAPRGLVMCKTAVTTFSTLLQVMIVRNCAIALSDGATEGLSVDAGIEENSGAVQAWMMVRGVKCASYVIGPDADMLRFFSNYFVELPSRLVS